MRPRSIRARLTVTLSIVTVLVVALSALASITVVSRWLSTRDAGQLANLSARVAASLRAAHGVRLDGATLRATVGPAYQVVLVAADGRTVSEGLSASDAVAVAAVVSPDPVEAGGDRLAVAVDTAGLAVTYRPDAGDTLTVARIVFAADYSDRAVTVATVAATVVSVAAVTIAVLIATAVVVVGNGLRPLRVMADRAEQVADGDRTRRLPRGDDGDPAISRLARTVNAAFDAQQDAENRMRSFIADASHELRSPLTAAHGWVELYLRGGLDDPDRLDAALTRVDTQLVRMRLLVDDLALLARGDAGLPVEQEPVDLGLLAAETVADARVLAPDRALRYEGGPVRLVGLDSESWGEGAVRALGPDPASRDAGEAVRVLGDPARLAQVLRNLVGNALQHTPPGAAITVAVVPGATAHTVTVSDTGPGIPVEHLPHLFERFWRADPARSTGGSGLGLAITQSLVNLHHGTIAVRSDPETGTVFTVTLPALR
ncbi:HAMP domain-containing sensor histidine kinase [Actinoplanes sp. NPDC051851]|uniref:sensor histidine kinase n=1 Tax=Actinoplanes sp. NPDC051851 TaxID=3154753 RepID=UPI0034348311